MTLRRLPSKQAWAKKALAKFVEFVMLAGVLAVLATLAGVALIALTGPVLVVSVALIIRYHCRKALS